jgi:hypothetical protein
VPGSAASSPSKGHVAASTQNQPLSALLVLSKDVLEIVSPGSTASCAVRNRADVRPLTPPVVLESICSGICDAPSQPLTTSEGPFVRMQVVGANRRGGGATKSIPDRYIQQAFVLLAVLRRSAYPVAEL